MNPIFALFNNVIATSAYAAPFEELEREQEKLSSYKNMQMLKISHEMYDEKKFFSDILLGDIYVKEYYMCFLLSPK